MIILEKAIFYDIPKTGGSWVSEGLMAYLKGEFVYESSHSPPGVHKQHEKEHAGKLKFTFVRHPVDWYRSYYASRLPKGEAMSFAEFIDHAYNDGPLWFNDTPWKTYSHYVKPFLKCDFVGKTENLVEDLRKVMKKTGMAGTGELFNRPKVNVAPRLVEVDDGVAKLIEKKERYIINKYYG